MQYGCKLRNAHTLFLSFHPSIYHMQSDFLKKPQIKHLQIELHAVDTVLG